MSEGVRRVVTLCIAVWAICFTVWSWNDLRSVSWITEQPATWRERCKDKTDIYYQICFMSNQDEQAKATADSKEILVAYVVTLVAVPAAVLALFFGILWAQRGFRESGGA